MEQEEETGANCQSLYTPEVSLLRDCRGVLLGEIKERVIYNFMDVPYFPHTRLPNAIETIMMPIMCEGLFLQRTKEGPINNL